MAETPEQKQARVEKELAAKLERNREAAGGSTASSGKVKDVRQKGSQDSGG